MLIPDKILQGRYRIIRQLGQGGMGAVYEALDERLDAVVALKETLFADERLRKQFEREARLLARMHHPALPRVSDHFAEGEGQFLVMQFIEGDDLAQMMTLRQGPFPPEQVLTWGDQLLDALDYLHTQNPQIIHRDIKPQNLKLTGRGQIILLDFGLAKGQSSEVSPAGPTTASIFGYTPNYAPLEQIQGLGTDARSDIYALSATLYHLITAVRPPSALTRAGALVNGQPDPLQPAHEINSAISPAVAGVLARAMSQNRDQRFATAAKMRRAMEDALRGINETEDTRTGETPTVINTLNPPVTGEAATVLFGPAGATLPAAPQLSHANVSQPTTARGLTGETTVQRELPAASHRRIATWQIAALALLLVGVVVGGLYAYQTRNSSSPSTPVQLEAQSTQPTPAPEAPVAAPVAGTVKEEPKAESSTPRQADNVARRNTRPDDEKVTEKADKIVSDKLQKDVDRAIKLGEIKLTPFPNAGAFPNQQKAPPEVNEPADPPADARRNPRGGNTSVRSFPDGTQVMTMPDGTRVVTFPNGTRRVFPSGVRLPQRRRQP